MHEHEPMSASTAGTFLAPAKELKHFLGNQYVYFARFSGTDTNRDVTSLSYGRMCNVLYVVKGKMASEPTEKKEARSSAARQLGGRHPSKLASPHSLNWHGAHQVRQ